MSLSHFSEDTPVSTEDGDVPISEIEVGDTVTAYDEETGEIGEYEVTHTIDHVDEIIIHLYIDGELIETTPEHPFYTVDDEWVNAAELEIGEEIFSLDGDYGTVEANVTIFDANQRMYNLTVDEANTFFVGDGDWLVHNVDCDEIAREAAQAEAARVKAADGDPSGNGKVAVIVDKNGELVVARAQSGSTKSRSSLDKGHADVLPSTSNHPDGIPPHACAEVNACDQLLRQTQLEMEYLPELNYTIATASIATGEIVDLCPNCEAWVPEYFNVVRPE